MTEPTDPRRGRRRAAAARFWALGLGVLASSGAFVLWDAVLAVVVVAACLGLMVVCAALFGSETASERAFRFLRWIVAKGEPPSPP